MVLYLSVVGMPWLLLADCVWSWAVIGPAGLGAGSRAAWACWSYAGASAYASTRLAAVESCLAWPRGPGWVEGVHVCADMKQRRMQERKCLAGLC